MAKSASHSRAPKDHGRAALWSAEGQIRRRLDRPGGCGSGRHDEPALRDRVGPPPWSLSETSEPQAREAQALSPRRDEHHSHGQRPARRVAPTDDLAPLHTRKTKNPAGPFTAQRGSFTSSTNTEAGDLAGRFARSVFQPEKLIPLDQNRTFVCPTCLLLYLSGGRANTKVQRPSGAWATENSQIGFSELSANFFSQGPRPCHFPGHLRQYATLVHPSATADHTAHDKKLTD